MKFPRPSLTPLSSSSSSSTTCSCRTLLPDSHRPRPQSPLVSAWRIDNKINHTTEQKHYHQTLTWPFSPAPCSSPRSPATTPPRSRPPGPPSAPPSGPRPVCCLASRRDHDSEPWEPHPPPRVRHTNWNKTKLPFILDTSSHQCLYLERTPCRCCRSERGRSAHSSLARSPPGFSAVRRGLGRQFRWRGRSTCWRQAAPQCRWAPSRCPGRRRWARPTCRGGYRWPRCSTASATSNNPSDPLISSIFLKYKWSSCDIHCTSEITCPCVSSFVK